MNLDTIQQSVVRVLSRGKGLGVIFNGHIFTHCVDVKSDGSLAVGHFQYQECETSNGQQFRLTLCLWMWASGCASPELRKPDLTASWSQNWRPTPAGHAEGKWDLLEAEPCDGLFLRSRTSK